MISPSTLTDQELVDGFRLRDAEIIESFYDQYLPKVQAMIMRYGGTLSDAEDIFHDALIAVYINIRRNSYHLDHKTHFSTYFFQVCKFRYLEQKRIQNRRQLIESDNLEFIFPSDEDIERDIELMEMSHRVHQLVEELDDHCIEILEAYYWQRKSMKEIADELNMHANSVRNAKYRCIQKLKKIIRVLKSKKKI